MITRLCGGEIELWTIEREMLLMPESARSAALRRETPSPGTIEWQSTSHGNPRPHEIHGATYILEACSLAFTKDFRDYRPKYCSLRYLLRCNISRLIPTMAEGKPQLHVAVVGGGIIGLVTAMGLLKRRISFMMYEQASSFREIGAGVAFTANAMECMKKLNPAIVDAVNAVATPNGQDTEKPNDYVRFHDGYNWDPTDPANSDDKLLGLLDTGYKGFQGCNRAHLVDELVKHIPDQAIEFKKRFTGYEEQGPGRRLLLRFHDGSTAEADISKRFLASWLHPS